jgi:hypothetical protein
MPNMPNSDAAEHRSQPRRSLVTSASARGTGEPRLAAGMLWHLILLGLIGVAIITVFAIASFSSLYPGSEIESGFSGVDRGEVNAARPDPSPSTDVNTAPVAAQPNSPGVEAPVAASASSLPSPPRDAAPMPPMPETNQSQTAGQPLSPSTPLPSAPLPSAPLPSAPLPSEGALQAKPKAPPKDVAPTSPFFAERPDRLFREFAIQQQHQQARPDLETAPNEKAATPGARDAPNYEHGLRTNTTLRDSRIKKECGPIKDPELYRDCVASFHIR